MFNLIKEKKKTIYFLLINDHINKLHLLTNNYIFQSNEIISNIHNDHCNNIKNNKVLQQHMDKNAIDDSLSNDETWPSPKRIKVNITYCNVYYKCLQ